MDVNYYIKFPSVFRKKLKSGEIQFPKDTIYQYESMVAYRGINRKESDNTPVNRNDFRSKAELHRDKKPRGDNCDENNPNYYGCSLFLNEKSLLNALKLPRFGRKVAKVFVQETGGPIQIHDVHLCWWMYEAYNDFGKCKIK